MVTCPKGILWLDGKTGAEKGVIGLPSFDLLKLGTEKQVDSLNQIYDFTFLGVRNNLIFYAINSQSPYEGRKYIRPQLGIFAVAIESNVGGSWLVFRYQGSTKTSPSGSHPALYVVNEEAQGANASFGLRIAQYPERPTGDNPDHTILQYGFSLRDRMLTPMNGGLGASTPIPKGWAPILNDLQTTRPDANTQLITSKTRQIKIESQHNLTRISYFIVSK